MRRGYDPLIGVLVPLGLPFGCFIAECGSSHKQKDHGFAHMLICPIWVGLAALWDNMTAAGIIHLELKAHNQRVYATMSYVVPTDDRTKTRKSWGFAYAN